MANEPITPSPSDTTPAPASVFRTYAKDLAALGGRAAQAVPPKQKAPTPAAPVPPPTPKPASEPPPARIIPKAPSTDESREAVLTRLRETSAPEQVGAAPASPIEPPAAYVIPKAPSTDESREAILARLKKNAASVNQVDAASSVPAEAQKPAPPKVPPVSAAPAPIHTYKTDFADHIDAKKASTFSVLAAQSDAGEVPAARIKERSRFPVAIVGGLVLILAGGGALYYALNVANQQPVIPYVSNVPSLIHADEQAKLQGEGAELMSALAENASAPLPQKSIRITYTALATTSPDGLPIDTPLPGGALIAALNLPAPEILLRNVEPASTVGIARGESEAHAFFIMKVSSYERTFAGMLEWEPRILGDLELLYPAYPNTDTGTSTPAVTALPAFEDEVVANRDARVLRDTLGRALVLYGYRDKETLIIARDEAAFSLLIERLGASRGQ